MSGDPGLTPEDVKEILRLIDGSRFDEFELETPRFSVRFSRSPQGDVLEPGRPDDSPGPSGLVEVASPLVGTLYRGSAPGEPPFVEVGTLVEVGAKLCIIEVMKLMNTVTADVSGEVAEVCVVNGAAVEYGEILFRIRTDA